MTPLIYPTLLWPENDLKQTWRKSSAGLGKLFALGWNGQVHWRERPRLMARRLCAGGVCTDGGSQEGFGVGVRVRNEGSVLGSSAEIVSPRGRQLEPSGGVPKFDDVAGDGTEFRMVENGRLKCPGDRSGGQCTESLQQPVQYIRPDDAFDRLEVTPRVAGPLQVKFRYAAEPHREKNEILERIRPGQRLGME